MKIIKKYQTADGQEFTDEAAAKQHEVEINALSQLRQLLSISISSTKVRQGNVDNVLLHILSESATVNQILQSYRKKQPRQKTESLKLQAA